MEKLQSWNTNYSLLLLAVYLISQGIKPREHAIKHELVRYKLHFDINLCIYKTAV